MDADIEQQSVLAMVDYHLRPRWTLGIGAGAILGGTLDTAAGTHHTFGPGVVFAVSASYLVVAGSQSRPFVVASASLGGSLTSTTEDGAGVAATGFRAVDGRLGVAVGMSCWRMSPYLTGRVFEGQFFWPDFSFRGRDLYRYQLGAGLVVRLPRGVDVNAELVPLGEQALTLGVGAAF